MCIDQEKSRKPLLLSFVDICKAYFNAIPERAIYMTLPKEMKLSPDLVARQVRCVYGTRGAGKLWEETYTQAMEHAGFVTGTADPCVLYHKVCDITIVVHGYDFTALGTDNDLDWHANRLKDNFEIELRMHRTSRDQDSQSCRSCLVGWTYLRN